MRKLAASLLVLVLIPFLADGRGNIRETRTVDFIVTDFGAKAKPGFDNRAAFQAAIDASYGAGGGIVYVPAGHYEFLSTASATKHVRVREGKEQHTASVDYNYVLRLPSGVQLVGEWTDPDTNGGKVEGTVLEVRVGKDSPACDSYVSSWWNDPQAGNALRTTYTSTADRFIEMNASTGVTDMSVWYPEQDLDDVKPYPWTFYQNGGDNATVERVTLVNAYNGIYCAPAELHYIHDDRITALHKAVEVHICTDIGRVEKVSVNPGYWANSGLAGAPSEAKVREYMLSNATGFEMHRSDWEYVSYLKISGCNKGVWIGREPGYKDAPNAQLYSLDVKDCADGLYVQDVNPYGILISNSSFGAAENGHSAYFEKDFETCVQFNGVSFDGPVLSDGNDGVISFECCRFADDNGFYAIELRNGNALLTQCEFAGVGRHVHLDAAAKSLGAFNSGREGKLDVVSDGAAVSSIVFDDSKLFEPMPSDVKTDIAVRPHAASDRVVKLNLPRETGYDDKVPTVDVSDMLQAELNALARRGGTLYLPAGRYLVDKPITVPSGVELKGSWNVPHHSMGGGTALFTTYLGNEAGESLISLEANAGICGLNIVQTNICDGPFVRNPLEAPFLIQGKGHGVYVINVTIPIGDKGIDLATYDTSGHYVDYLGGVLLRAGIWVGGGAEGGYIRNMQLNPHYGSRLPLGGQGYPNVNTTRFLQTYLSALKFADVKNQTIFNNFVYGSVYGVHFLKDSVTGRYPGSMTMVGHGSDGCTFSLFVEDADENTRIIGINSELVNTHIRHQKLRSYVLMGREPGALADDATLTLYNSAFWGSPTVAITNNAGTLVLGQGNLESCGHPCINVAGGSVTVRSSYFAQPVMDEVENAVLENVYFNKTSRKDQ